MPSRKKTNTPKLILVCGTALTVLLGAGLFFSSVQPVYPEAPLIAPEAVEAIVPEPAEAFVKQRTFGHSEKGRTIEGYEVGSGEEVLFLFGGIHGNEMGTVELLNQLVMTITADPTLVATTKKVIIVPLVNPDGYHDGIYRNNANGVNVNRNFPTTEWIVYPDQDTFAGDKPFSERESQTIKAIVEEYKPDVMIAFHSQGGVVSPEAGAESMALAAWYIEQSGYIYFNDWDYPGTATRWFTESTGNPSLTVEVTDHAKSDWEINRPALLELIEE